MPENSGPQWVNRFPNDNNLTALIEPFRDKATRFVNAMKAAGMEVSVTAVFRPAERAYLMHWAWMIAREGHATSGIPAMAGVDIDWNWSGGHNAAEQMVEAFGIVFEPVLQSRHTQRRAVDMDISWNGHPTIVKADGSRDNIQTGPTNGQNAELQSVGRGYGVIKLTTDPPHWSDDGH